MQLGALDGSRLERTLFSLWYVKEKILYKRSGQVCLRTLYVCNTISVCVFVCTRFLTGAFASLLLSALNLLCFPSVCFCVPVWQVLSELRSAEELAVELVREEVMQSSGEGLSKHGGSHRPLCFGLPSVDSSAALWDGDFSAEAAASEDTGNANDIPDDAGIFGVESAPDVSVSVSVLCADDAGSCCSHDADSDADAMVDKLVVQLRRRTTEWRRFVEDYSDHVRSQPSMVACMAANQPKTTDLSKCVQRMCDDGQVKVPLLWLNRPKRDASPLRVIKLASSDSWSGPRIDDLLQLGAGAARKASGFDFERGYTASSGVLSSEFLSSAMVDEGDWGEVFSMSGE